MFVDSRCGYRNGHYFFGNGREKTRAFSRVSAGPTPVEGESHQQDGQVRHAQL